MPSIFFEDPSGKLKCPPLEVGFAAVSGLGVGYYTMLIAPLRITTLAFKSTLSTEIQVFLVNPEDDTSAIQPWIKLSNGDTFSTESLLPPQMYLPPRTKLLLKPTGADPISGKLTLVYWGG
jgi:hypothetical protein